MVGGTSDLKAPDETVMQVTASVRPAVEERLGKRFDIFQPVAYKSQVVAGRNFFVKGWFSTPVLDVYSVEDSIQDISRRTA
ncbi:hypothetical protein QYM36_010180 [Artemia franciscana]|uniref:Uncharacterized protein n=1 Tax=Artemia franciscana TaxID=6661 RepID=A0AA88HUT3_ARTSF|nr:hypothetical protein QYM36_010180 [Artemia franciscana]